MKPERSYTSFYCPHSLQTVPESLEQVVGEITTEYELKRTITRGPLTAVVPVWLVAGSGLRRLRHSVMAEQEAMSFVCKQV